MIIGITGCAGESFSVRSGFTEYFDRYPPDQTLPGDDVQQLLAAYQPRVYAAKNQQFPIDFYEHYIANGTLYVDGKRISDEVNAGILNAHKDNPTALFKYEGETSIKAPATIYARADTDVLTYREQSFALQFLTYNFVFPTSGMVSGLGFPATLGLSVVGNLKDWHQLDHYVGLSIALYREKPIAVMLQQHNYQSTYVIGREIQLPADNRLAVDIALRSNELYLHHPGKKEHPAVSFVTAANIEFMITGNSKPMMSGFDVTSGDIEVDYTLQILPQSDAFYQFKGHLGKSRLLPGRDGPPGADYVTLPALMPRATRLVTGYRGGALQQETEKIGALFDEKTFSINDDAIEAYKRDFLIASGLLQ